MAFIRVALSDAKEVSAVPEGEYDLRIVKTEDKKSKGEGGKAVRDMTVVTLRVEDPNYPNAQLLNHYITYPLASDPPETKALMLRNIARFIDCFGVPHDDNGFDSADLSGLTGHAYLGQRIPENAQTKDPVNELVLPKMKDRG